MTLNEKELLCEKLDKNLDKMKYNCKGVVHRTDRFNLLLAPSDHD